MSLRTEYVRNFYANHQTNFGQPDGTPNAVVRAAALREFDEWLREVKAEAWDEGCAAAEQYYKRTVVGVPGSDPIPAPLNPHKAGGR